MNDVLRIKRQLEQALEDRALAEAPADQWVEVAMIVADRYARALRDFEPVEAKDAREFLLSHLRGRLAFQR